MVLRQYGVLHLAPVFDVFGAFEGEGEAEVSNPELGGAAAFGIACERDDLLAHLVQAVEAEAQQEALAEDGRGHQRDQGAGVGHALRVEEEGQAAAHHPQEGPPHRSCGGAAEHVVGGILEVDRFDVRSGGGDQEAVLHAQCALVSRTYAAGEG